MTRRLDTVILIAGLVIVWAIAAQFAGRDALATPFETLERTGELLVNPGFWKDLAVSGRTLAIAFVFVLVIGLGLGLLIGSSRLASDVADPLLGSLYSIPKITLYPIILLFFGLSLSATVTFAAIHGIFPLMIFTIAGLRKVPDTYYRTAQTLRLRRTQTIVSILLPAALPEIVAGIRVGFSTTLLGTIIAELFASTAGAGSRLIRATEIHDVTDIMAITLVLFVFAFFANSLLMKLEGYVRHE
jgi:NitT/TauT family transport system permease protein